MTQTVSPARSPLLFRMHLGGEGETGGSLEGHAGDHRSIAKGAIKVTGIAPEESF